jgi:hypothetical protein
LDGFQLGDELSSCHCSCRGSSCRSSSGFLLGKESPGLALNRHEALDLLDKMRRGNLKNRKSKVKLGIFSNRTRFSHNNGNKESKMLKENM